VNKNTELDRSVIAARMIDELENVYRGFIEKGSSWIVEEWKKRNITLGKRVNIISQQGNFHAEVLDITGEGKLIIKDEHGKVHEMLSGEISLREAE
jgi:BirA family biotin operon repressor/biotin-[acetyl-CoA-carboxylase] ligase